MIAIPFVAMIFALLLGVPIAFSLAGSGILGIYLVTGSWSKVMGILGMAPFSTVADYTLTTIPMFMLMAYFSASSGLARDLFKAGANCLSHIRGGLGVATVFACGIFGAMSGASVAAASVMSTIAYPEMRRYGYSEALAAGTVGIGATLDLLIPPSVAFIIYGVTTQTSIAELLIAGVIPGIIVGILLTISIFVWVVVRPQDAPATYHVSWSERWTSIYRVWPSLVMITIVIVFLYSGIVTPTEVGAIGASLAAVIGAAFGRLSWPGVYDALKQTVRTSAMIFTIIIGAMIFGYYMTLSRIPQHVVSVVIEADLNRWVVIICIVVSYFVVSMFMDEIPLLLLTLQLTFPLITHLGFDPIWFGVMSVMMVAMGLVFPPVGMIAFVVSATAKVDLVRVYTGTGILTIALLLGTVFIMIFPEVVIWLPATMR